VQPDSAALSAANGQHRRIAAESTYSDCINRLRVDFLQIDLVASKSIKLKPKATSRVAIVVGKPGLGLQPLVEQMPVWAADNPHYKKLAERFKKSLPDASLTLCKSDPDASPEEELLAWLPAVDLHHGDASPTPWNELQIYGAGLTSAIRAALEDYGVDEITETIYGFRATR